MEGGIQEGDGRDHLAEGISATLETIRRQIEEGSGKVETPRPPGGVEPPSPKRTRRWSKTASPTDRRVSASTPVAPTPE